MKNVKNSKIGQTKNITKNSKMSKTVSLKLSVLKHYRSLVTHCRSFVYKQKEQ